MDEPSRLPLRWMTGTQAKLMGSAFAVLILFFWGASVEPNGRFDPQTGTGVPVAVTIIMVALVDLVLGGKPRSDEDTDWGAPSGHARREREREWLRLHGAERVVERNTPRYRRPPGLLDGHEGSAGPVSHEGAVQVRRKYRARRHPDPERELRTDGGRGDGGLGEGRGGGGAAGGEPDPVPPRGA
jgi:hypothetical protein